MKKNVLHFCFKYTYLTTHFNIFLFQNDYWFGNNYSGKCNYRWNHVIIIPPSIASIWHFAYWIVVYSTRFLHASEDKLNNRKMWRKCLLCTDVNGILFDWHKICPTHNEKWHEFPLCNSKTDQIKCLIKLLQNLCITSCRYVLLITFLFKCLR